MREIKLTATFYVDDHEADSDSPTGLTERAYDNWTIPLANLGVEDIETELVA